MCMIITLQVAGSIPGTSTILNVDYIWNEVYAAAEELDRYLTEK